jgi:hypothetical protein
MSYCCYAGDLDPTDFSSTRWPTAAKEYRCCECRIKIKVGELYERVSLKSDGHFYDYKTCEKCADLRDSLGDVTCVPYEGLEDAYTDWLTDGPHRRMTVKSGTHAARLVPSYYVDEEDDE